MGLSNVLKSALPFLAAALNAGGLPGTLAANALGQVLGVEKLPGSPQGIEDAISAAAAKDPDIMLKLKQAEQDFQLKMQQMGIDSVEKLEELAAADRASARAREVAVRDHTPAVLAYGITGGFFTLLGIMMFHAVPQASERILDVMVGSLGTAWIGVVSYYFGSSAGSASKNALIEKLTTTGGNVVDFVKKAA